MSLVGCQKRWLGVEHLHGPHHSEAGMTIAEATHLVAIGAQCHAIDIKNVED